MINIPANFWEEVEKPLKHVLYGDSVSSNSKTVIIINNKTLYVEVEFIWDTLVSYGYEVVNQEGNEYIYLDDNVKILTYDVEQDILSIKNPLYIMRHKFIGSLIRLNLTNMAFIDVTKNHSLIGYSDKALHKISPLDANYVAICKNNIDTSLFEYDLLSLLFGLWLSNGSLTYKQSYPYPSFSLYKKDLTLKLITELDNHNEIFNIYQKNQWDCLINHKELQNLLLDHGYDRLNSPDRYIHPNIKELLKSNINAFLSFLVGYYIGDGSFTTNMIVFSTASIVLANDIIELLMCYGIYSHLIRDKNGRSYNGKVKGDMYTIKLVGLPLSILELLKTVEHLKGHVPIEEHGTYYGKGNSPLNNGSIVRDKSKAHIHNIKPIRIQSKEDILYDGYVYDFEVPSTHNFIINGVLVHNTDSLYVHIPKKFDTIESSIDGCEEIANHINDLIKLYYNSSLLPRMGVDPKYNETFFKTELTANAIMFLDTKKNYAYNQTSKESKIFNPPKTKYTGIPVIKSDTVPFLKDFIKHLVEKIAFVDGIDKIEALNQLSIESRDTIIRLIKSYDFAYIAAPGKWSDKDYTNEPAPIVGMKLYNTLLNKDVFRSGAFCLHIPIKFRDVGLLASKVNPIKYNSKNYLGNISLEGINYLSFPYSYNPEELRILFEENGLYVEFEDFWNWSRLVGNIVADRIIKVIVQSK